MLHVHLYSCGLPKRSMGWYHAKQLLDQRFPEARLAHVIEPFLLNQPSLNPDFADWKAAAEKQSVEFHKCAEAAPQASSNAIALICGRTHDNPELFRAAVAKGFKLVILEKPGAPSAAELEAMSNLAKEHGVRVFMGFNRNFSAYVKQLSKQATGTDLSKSKIVLGRCDIFNSDEAMDECFERNAEGLLANMLCHEIMVLMSYFQLKKSNIKQIEVDQAHCSREVRRGMTDFTKARFTITLHNGCQLSVWGNRAGGEFAEAVLSTPGQDDFRSFRPDASLATSSERLEKELPGCQAYFYLQDAEYADLKQSIFSHVLAGKPGSPPGVADIDSALEMMEVISMIQKELDGISRPSFELSLANHPSSWGVDYADGPTNPPWDGVLKCIGEAGFEGTELGPVGYYKSEALTQKLNEHKLQLVAGNIFEKLHELDELPKIMEKVHASCKILKQHNAKYFVIVPHVVEERVPTAGRPENAPKLDSKRWEVMMQAIKDVALVTKSYGILSVLHPHSGAWLETEDEVDRAMKELPADLVGLCLDTGHFLYAGMDPVAKYQQYASRTPFMHFKDVNASVLKSLRENKEGFWHGVTQGVFCPLGKGLVDFPRLLNVMQQNAFTGWVTVEQDFDNNTPDVEARLMIPYECSKENLKYLRSLGIVPVSKVAVEKNEDNKQYTGRFDGSNAKHASPAMAALAMSKMEEDLISLPTSTKWSVLSSRVEGLVAELNQIVGKQDAYCISVSGHEGKAMQAVREKMLQTPWGKEWAERRTMFSYGEEMSTDPLEALLLKQFVFMGKPARVLEVGMFVGYGAAAMLEGSPTVEVVSLEIDPYLKDWLQTCLTSAGCAHFLDRHHIMLGPALESLPKLKGTFDMVFVDANKAEYKQYVEDILSFNLLAPGGVIICDNVLYNGLPYTSNHFDAQPLRRNFGNAIKDFNQWIVDHPELEQVMLPVRDGISIVRRKTDTPGQVAQASAQVAVPAGKGNLAHFDDTWHIMQESLAVPQDAVVSDCSVKPRESEYGSSCQPCTSTVPQAWWSKSVINFDYRVVEVTAGELLNPSCDALVFGHLEPGSPEREAALKKPQRRLVVVDKKVHQLYGNKIKAYFASRGVTHELLVLDTVEENKSIDLTLEVCKKMKKFNIDRRLEPVIAIGGGVCLDVVGLAASMFRRRTPYIRVPTTSLAYVDASVGAKNGCNFAGSKNRLGTYVPPVAALLDSSFFRTQDTRDISNSLGEMCKMGIMKSAELLELLEQHGPRLIADKFAPRGSEDGVPGRVLQISIETMLEELAPNLWENCLDRLVDFGHAVGQNLEMKALGTDVELMHGEAVATDMSYMTVLSNVIGVLSDSDRDRILRILHTCGLPTYHPMLTREFFKEAMEDRIQNSMGMRLPLPAGFGKARMFNNVSDKHFEQAFVLWEKLTSSSTVSVHSPLVNSPPRFVPGVKAYYTFPPAPNALMVDIFMREKGIDTVGITAYEHYIDLPALENRNAECLKMNPQGSLPWFVLDDDTVIAETIAMCEYVDEMLPDEPRLVGASAKERGVVRQWQRRMEEHYCYPAFYGHRSWTCSSDCPDDHFMKNFFAQRLNEHHGASLLPESWKDLCRWARNRMVWLERVKQESPSTFIAGDKFTVVDVQVYVTLWFFSEAFPHPPQRILQELQGQLPWVQRWFDAVHDRPACRAAREYREKNMQARPTAQSKPEDQPKDTLGQLKQHTVIVADTGDLESIKLCKPTDATTNPSLILNAAKMPQYKHLLEEAVDWAMSQQASDSDVVSLMVDRCCVNFGAEILKEVPGYISTEVDASLSYDVDATIQRAEGIIAMYAEKGVSKDRVLIKLAATWEGVKAAEELESRGIQCNLTLLFGFCQAVICAEAGVTLISPFVGRIMDWFKKELKVDGFEPSDDPGCKSVKRIFNYYKKHGYKTIVMGASFRNAGQLLELSGVDRLTIDPKFLKQLAESEVVCDQKLSVESALLSTDDSTKLELDEEEFRRHLAEDRMASEKLTEGIEKFIADKEKLEIILQDLLKERRALQPRIKLSTPTFRVDGRSFIVTGSTSGLGREIARSLARQGARGVLIHGTSAQRGNEVVESIAKEFPGCKVLFKAADLHDASQCASLVPAAEHAFGTIDGLVNSAATCFPRGTLEDTSLELWDGMFHLNTRAVFLVTQAVAKHMREHKVQGSIVNIASIAAQGGAPWITAYSASKAAVVSMTKTNAFELRAHGIRVNAINMGWCLTDKEMQGQNSWKGEDWLVQAEQQHPMGRLMRPVDVAGTVGHLLSDAATMLTGAIIDFAPEQITGTYA
jgi:transaldolase